MAHWTKEIRLFAKKRWHEGATLQQIADEIYDGWGRRTTRQSIHVLAKKNPAHFPPRSREEINARISAGMVRAYSEGRRERAFPKNKNDTELVTDGW